MLRAVLSLGVAALLAACGDDSLTDVDPDAWQPPIDTDAGGDTGGDRDADAPDVADADTGGDIDGDAGDSDVPPAETPFAIAEFNVIASNQDLAALHADPRSGLEIDATIEYAGRRYDDCELEVHGGYSRTLPKLSYRITFDRDDPLRTMLFSEAPEEHRRIVLHASWIDPTYARNCLTMDLVRTLGGMSPRCQYANLSFNGVYQGFYIALERIDETYLERNGLDDDGLLVKAESHDANWAQKPNPLAGFDVKSDEAPTDAVGELLRVIHETPATWEAFEAEVRPWINLDAFTVFQLAHTLANNRDTFTKNYYLYYDWEADDAAFELISWDADATWGIGWDGSVASTAETRWHGTDAFSPRLFSIDAYRRAYLDEYTALVNDPVFEAMMLENAEERRARIAEAARRDLDAWDRGIDFDAASATLANDIAARFEAMRGALAEP